MQETGSKSKRLSSEIQEAKAKNQESRIKKLRSTSQEPVNSNQEMKTYNYLSNYHCCAPFTYSFLFWLLYLDSWFCLTKEPITKCQFL